MYINKGKSKKNSKRKVLYSDLVQSFTNDENDGCIYIDTYMNELE